MMSWRYGIFSFLLLVAVVLLSLKNYGVWTQPMETLQEEGRIKKGETRVEGASVPGRQKEATSIASYISISEKNIFNPERKEFSVTSSPDQMKPMTRPQIILYGIAIKGDYQAATIANPGRPLRKGEREMMTLKIGERVGEYKLSKILADRITMEAGEDSYEVLLFDPNLPKKRTLVRTESKPVEKTAASPSPTPSPPAPAPRAAEAPKPAQPSGESVIEPPLPRPVSPSPPSSPSPYRGRRPIAPYTPPQSEGQ